jgi:hypothetical protein
MRQVEKYKYKNGWVQNLKWCTIPILLVASLALTSVAKAGDVYAVWVPKGVITMDVVKQDGQGSSGTWLCKSLKACYTKVLEAEERGATEYCETITIKRDGVPVWHRDYNSPYWVALQNTSSMEFPTRGRQWEH